MLGIPAHVVGAAAAVLGQAGVDQTPREQFDIIFLAFVSLGTLVGVSVIGYTLFNAYKYREGSGSGEKADVTRPEPGQIPTGSGGGKKLFLSFGLSALIVLSLVVWTYMGLLYVENAPEENDPDLTVDVVGEQFSWRFVYPNGHETIDTLVVPEDQLVQVNVTTADVFHNFGIPEFRVKADAMPGHTLESWFVPDETGEYEAICYELCGAGHSNMRANVTVLSEEEFQEWYAQTEGSSAGAESENATTETQAGENGNMTAGESGESHALGGAV